MLPCVFKEYMTRGCDRNGATHYSPIFLRQRAHVSGHCGTLIASARCHIEWQIVSDRMSDRMSEEMSDRIPDAMSEHMSDSMWEYMPGRMSEYNTHSLGCNDFGGDEDLKDQLFRLGYRLGYQWYQGFGPCPCADDMLIQVGWVQSGPHLNHD